MNIYTKIFSIFFLFTLLTSPVSVHAETYDGLILQIKDLLAQIVELQARIQALESDTPAPQVAGTSVHSISVEWTRAKVDHDQDHATFYMDFGGNTPASYRMRLICDEDVVEARFETYNDGCGDSVLLPWSPRVPNRIKQGIELENFGDTKEKVVIEFILYDADGTEMISTSDYIFVERRVYIERRRDHWRWN